MQTPSDPRILWLLRRADDALILGHRLSEWCGHGPTPEEDLALANIGLDQIGLARALYQAAEAGTARTEDQLAYLRTEREYLNCLLAEQPNGDFAHTIVRQLLYSAALDPYLARRLRLVRPGHRRDRREGGEGIRRTIFAMPANGRCASATARQRAIGARGRRWRHYGRSSTSCSRPTRRRPR